MRKLDLKTFVPPGRYFHLHRTELLRNRRDEGHHHGYAEVFWVEDGCIQHIRNTITEKLFPGDVAWIRRGDCHAFKIVSPKATILNLAFDDCVLENLEKRYYSAANPAPWQIPLDHTINHLSTSQLSDFRHFANLLAFGPQQRLALEAFVINLLQALSANSQATLSIGEDCPPWLRKAIFEFIDQQLWDATPQEFAELAGRSVEHVCRTVRKHCGKTTSELLNKQRIEKAAADLCMTNKEILQIAMESGFENLGYFYRLFRRQFGTSPRKFRTLRQSLILNSSCYENSSNG